ncbi:MAG: Na(+)/H(+) antiporter subunit B [Alphaproteobacteria bacterium]|nr:Na(+)/H(+) antiporter subunit B [Alphaproteobacteria bacterium]
MIHHLILRVVAKLLIPYILLFGLYVQFHGDFGPGGGFQAGVIFASAFVLYALIYGVEKARQVIPDAVLRVGIGLGVLIYGGTGVVSLLLGANYLDYSPLAHDAPHGQHIGIFAVELGVGITVASVMATIFFQFAGRSERDEED